MMKEKDFWGEKREMKIKNIKFKYYGVVRQKKEKNRWKGQGSLDIIPWIDIVESKEFEKKAIRIGDIKARIEEIQYNTESDIWLFRFMKLRDDDIPSIVKEKCAATAINLKEDESLGENVFLLYDNNTGISMIQSTTASLGIGRLEKLFTTIWNIENERIKIKPILDKDSLEKIGRKKCREVEVGFANIEKDQSEGHSALGRVLDVYREMQGTSGKISIKLGRSKLDDTLNIDGVQTLLGEAVGEPCVTSAKMLVTEEDEDRWINLFDEICYDIIDVEVEERKPINFSVISDKMLGYYEKRKDYLDTLIHPGLQR